MFNAQSWLAKAQSSRFSALSFHLPRYYEDKSDKNVQMNSNLALFQVEISRVALLFLRFMVIFVQLGAHFDRKCILNERKASISLGG